MSKKYPVEKQKKGVYNGAEFAIIMTLERSDTVLSSEKEKRHPFVHVIGVTASGKSTFCKLLSRSMGYSVIPELPVTEHPLYKQYYEDPDNYAFGAQVIFAFDKWLKIKGSKELKVRGAKDMLKKRPVVLEVSNYEDAIYAGARFGNNPFLKEEYDKFVDGLFSVNGLPHPDVVAHLYVSFESMLARITKRASANPERTDELKEKPEYWRSFWDLLEGWVQENPLNLNIVTINMDEFDYTKYKRKKDANDALIGRFRELTHL